MDKFYVYLHIKETDGTPFYVGKGSKNRAYSKHKRSNFWSNIVNKYSYDVIILEDNLTEEEAFEREMYWIDRIGRRDLDKGPLVNMTNGGEGLINPSKEVRNKISNTLKGRKMSNEAKQNQSDSWLNNNRVSGRKGKTNSDYQKQKASRILIDIQTGIFYNSIKEASELFDINRNTLQGRINKYQDKTNLRYA